MGVIKGENNDVPIPIVVEKITVNLHVDHMVRQDNFLVDEPSQLEPTTGEIIRSTWWTSDVVHHSTKKLPSA